MTSDRRLLELAYEARQDSHDPDTHLGVVIACQSGPIISGSNCLAPNVEPTSERLTRPAKYDWVDHGEIVAIAKAAVQGTSTRGATMALTWYPCLRCAAAVARAGIKRLVCVPARMDDPRYTFAGATEVLERNGIEIIPMEPLK